MISWIDEAGLTCYRVDVSDARCQYNEDVHVSSPVLDCFPRRGIKVATPEHLNTVTVLSPTGVYIGSTTIFSLSVAVDYILLF